MLPSVVGAALALGNPLVGELADTADGVGALAVRGSAVHDVYEPEWSAGCMILEPTE